MTSDLFPACVPSADEDRWTAVHEAGHACVAIAYGFRVWIAAMCDTECVSVLGFVGHSGPPVTYRDVVNRLAAHGLERPVAPAGRLTEAMALTLAGPIAESRARGIPYNRVGMHAWCDVLNAERMLEDALRCVSYRPAPFAFLQVVEGITDKMVATHWGWIERVAAELVVKRQLTGDDVRALRPTSARREGA